MTTLAGLTLAAQIPVAGLASDVTLDAIAQGSDITTNNVTINKHGLCPKLPSDATKYLDGTGAYTVPPGSGGITTYDYAPITANVTVSGTSGAQTTVITGASVPYNGTTLVKIEFSAPVIEVAAQVGNFVAIELWDGATDLCELVGSLNNAANVLDLPAYGCIYLTPSNASHQFIVKAFRSGSGGMGNGLVAAGNGSGGNFAPAFLRITGA